MKANRLRSVGGDRDTRGSQRQEHSSDLLARSMSARQVGPGSLGDWRARPKCPGVQPGLPTPRGPISGQLIEALSHAPGRLEIPLVSTDDAIIDDDLQLALYCCYELHYQGFPGVHGDWEWEPILLQLRRELEGEFETQLLAALPRACTPDAGDVPDLLWDLSRGGKFSLSGWLLEHGTRAHAQELAIHRSGYQLKEADPHTWGIPRLTGRAKAAMVTIQSDEYGGGTSRAMHSSLFADAMTALGLDATYGAYLDSLPGITLATTNLISMFGLHRRLRGALVGHLASFEMNSVGPMGIYSLWLESLGVPIWGRRFYDVHVEADEVHQHIAVNELVGGLLQSESDQGAAVMFGARAVGLVEGLFADHVVSAWKGDRSSLRGP